MDTILSTSEFELASKKITTLTNRAWENEGFATTPGALKTTQDSLQIVTAGVEASLSATTKLRSNSVEFKVNRLLRQLRPEVIALACLMPALNSGAQAHTHRDAALAVGGALWTECYAAKLLVTDRKVSKGIVKTAGERFGSVKLRQAKVAKDAEKRLGFTMEHWSNTMLAQAGQWGLNILLQTMPDVFELRKIPNDTEKAWTITDAAAERIETIVDEAVLKSPVYQPRTEKPAPWTGFYAKIAEDRRFAQVAVPFVRTLHKETTAAVKHAIRAGDMDAVMRAVNRMQEVPYKINSWVLAVMQECETRGIKVAGVPHKDLPKVDKRSTDEAWAAMTPLERESRASKISDQKKALRIAKAKRLKFAIDMRVARRMQAVEQFYTPMNLDWRGRCYFLTQFNFQREDYIRGVFLFANGKPVGERGIYHLKLQVANTGDFDKISKKSMDERIAWTDANLHAIKRYVEAPLKYRDWTQADKPFAFLAACRELVNAIGNPGYVCHLPVAFDGSCNGLQHLCAMTRDPQGRLVNLTDNDEPQDVYQVVADAVKAMVDADKANNDSYYSDDKERKANATVSSLALTVDAYGINRSLVKRNVLSFAYSSKENGMKDQHMVDTVQEEAREGNYPFGETYSEQQMVAGYLAKRTMAAIKSIIQKPADAMAFMQKLAQALAHEGKALEWKTPLGLPWINRYHAPKVERVKLHCYSKGVTIPVDMMLAEGFEEPIEKREVSNGVAPNFVHALDACHLQMSVNASADRGIVDVATVHDSFACLPSDADLFNEVIREQFLVLYTGRDVLQELLDSAVKALTPAGLERLEGFLEKNPKPQMGTLDLQEVLSSKYAFA